MELLLLSVFWIVQMCLHKGVIFAEHPALVLLPLQVPNLAERQPHRREVHLLQGLLAQEQGDQLILPAAPLNLGVVEGL